MIEFLQRILKLKFNCIMKAVISFIILDEHLEFYILNLYSHIK